MNATPSRTRITERAAGLVLKRLVLAFGATYLGMVCVTNLVNFANVVGGTDAKFLNSENADYIASIAKIYSMPGWFDDLAVLGAATIEGIGALLFVRALLRYRGGGTGVSEAYQALAWNIAVWFAFIVGTEFLIAYPSEGPFRELLGLGFLMALVITVVPDSSVQERLDERIEEGRRAGGATAADDGLRGVRTGA